MTQAARQADGVPLAAAGKRERLVAAARQMFHEHGVEKTTLAGIAAAAGVPAGNDFYYFQTKDALISAVIGAYGDAQTALRPPLTPPQPQDQSQRQRLSAGSSTPVLGAILLA